MNFKNITIIGLVAVLAGFTTTVQATTKNTKTIQPRKAIVLAPSIIEVVSNLPTDAQLEKYTKEIESRHPASSGITPSEDLMSPYMKAFRDAFISARKGEDINSLFKKLENDYTAFEKSPEFNDPKYNDFRYFGARVLPFRKMAGYVWRMVPVVEDAKIRASQEALLSSLRSMAEQVKNHAPNSHQEAIYRFLTEPQEGYLTRFKNEGDVQDFYAGVIAPEVANAVTRIRKIDLTKPIVLDERLRFGDVSFPDSNEKRFRLFGEGEKTAVLAKMCRRMADLLVFSSYDFTDYLKIRRDMGQKQGIDVVFSGEIGGLTREARVDILHKYPNFGEKRANAAINMKSAFSFLYLEAYYLNAGYRVVKQEETNDNWLLEPEIVQSHAKLEEKSLKSALALTRSARNEGEDGTVTLNSRLTGETVRVNLKNYFYNPPSSLQDLFPTEFDQSPKYLSDKSYCPDCKYRNYFYGRAIGWNKDVYVKLFPDLKTGRDVAHAQDILSEARGGRLVANFLAPVIR